MSHKVSILAVALLLSSAVSGASLTGTVVYIVDGDTLDFAAPGQKTIRVRLAEIDSPETHQAYGQESRSALLKLCDRAPAQVDYNDTDRYGRVIGHVHCRGVDANREQVRTGSAWVYPQYAKDRSLYLDEATARAAHRGLWADSNPTAPWTFRHAGH